jgi:hypothetical protein
MKLPLFTETIHCSSRRERGACKVCRSSRRFREQLTQSFSLPDDDPNFDCPHGVEWINKPKATEEAKPKPGPPSITRQALNITRHALHGAASIAKTSLGIDRASDEQVEARLNVCRRCPGGHTVWKNGDVHTCGPMLDSMRTSGQGTCGCILHKKARDLAEGCPHGWWPGIE